MDHVNTVLDHINAVSDWLVDLLLASPFTQQAIYKIDNHYSLDDLSVAIANSDRNGWLAVTNQTQSTKHSLHLAEIKLKKIETNNDQDG